MLLQVNYSFTPTLGSASAHDWRRICEIHTAIQKIESPPNRIATPAEIAFELGLDEAKYRDCILYLSRFAAPSLRPAAERDVFLLDYGTGGSLAYGVPQAQVISLMAEALLRMPYQEQMVLSLHFKEKLNPAELAFVMNSDEASVSFLFAHAVFRLRSYLTLKWPAAGRIN